ncbi:MAG: DoxX family membrane protein [Blastochloris sp.]|nr:DoxX family membrane protein [Blastochloris sp.]
MRLTEFFAHPVSSLVLLLLPQMLLGFLFVLAGATKLSNRTDFEQVVASYRLGGPTFAKLVSFSLPTTELAVGLLLLGGLFTPFATIVTWLLLATFLAIAVYNAITKKAGGCGCFGSLSVAEFGWKSVAIRNFLLLVGAALMLAALALQVSYQFSAFNVAIGVLLAIVGLILGLSQGDAVVTQNVTSDGIGRRGFLRYAGTAVVGALASMAYSSPAKATAASAGTIVRSEEKVSSLEEAIRLSPAKLLVPTSTDYVLNEVGVFRDSKGNVTDVLLHYASSTSAVIFVDFQPRADKAATLNNPAELRQIQGRSVQFSTASSNPPAVMASWVDVDWTIAVVGFGATTDDLVSIIKSM